jgi:hypothetical protein
MLQHQYCLSWLICLVLLCPAPSPIGGAAASSSTSSLFHPSSPSLKQQQQQQQQQEITTRMAQESEMRTDGHHHETYDATRRSLQIVQDEDNSNIIRISLSIWAAQVDSEADLLIVLEHDSVQNGIANAVLQVLCSVTDLRLVDRAGTFFDTEILDMFDTCRQFSGRGRRERDRRRRRRTQEASSSTSPMPAVVSAWHKTAVMLRVSDDLLWSTWTFTFPVLRVGQLYIEEAMMNNQGISIADIGDAAVEALEQVSQLALDVSMMEGKLDDILHRTVDARILYASPVLQETSVFPTAALDYEENFQFNARLIYPMRVCGVLVSGSPSSPKSTKSSRRSNHAFLKNAKDAVVVHCHLRDAPICRPTTTAQDRPRDVPVAAEPARRAIRRALS